MVHVDICSECRGRGTSRVHNAYDLNDYEDIICEVCGGDGMAEEDEGTPFLKFSRKPKVDPTN